MTTRLRRILRMGAVLSATAMGLAQPGLAQYFPSLGAPNHSEPQADIVLIGETPDQWTYYADYWQQLVNVGQPLGRPLPVRGNGDALDPVLRSASAQPPREWIQNLVVRNLELRPIIKLNGSSQVFGLLTNRNSQTVTVTGVNFEIRDRQGNLIQTGSATPTPSQIAPGQTVSFSQTLFTVPRDDRFSLRLAQPAFLLNGSAPSERANSLF
ncbi:FxLYD domain-containing protein [Lyngbya confervoides]|uniref:FxLYD domain-containing protein n=1 Tax=Lyngbya confervoides BDU141951 TaxID=1574623 RepID=A0ABD4T448_9CYAN|nr:FxLYD domain-containing protein [Lyngbya confervoides]MCM1983446.1 FxLYD domain-containing protein [Lyngbya confervoides BDU141951]